MTKQKKGGKTENRRGDSLVSDVDAFIREGPGKRFIEPRILFLLSRSPAHGYDLLARMGEVPMPGPVPDTGAVYRRLRSMEEKGLVVSRWMESESGPQKRVYRITGAGRKRLATWVEAIRKRVDTLRRFLDLYDREQDEGRAIAAARRERP